MNCQSCGMPMATDADHGGARVENPYCKYCTDPSGNLKSKEEVREGMINFQMQQSPGKTREEIAAEVDQHMRTMPAWQTPTQVTPQTSVEETQVPPIPETPLPGAPPPTGTPTEPTQPTRVPSTQPPTTETPPASAPPVEEEQV
ncbi:MAG: zinc ribbon domain-containing protein [Patescibacteria group bacterium]